MVVVVVVVVYSKALHRITLFLWHFSLFGIYKVFLMGHTWYIHLDTIDRPFIRTELRDVNEKTRMYEDRPNFRDLNKISEC